MHDDYGKVHDDYGHVHGDYGHAHGDYENLHDDYQTHQKALVAGLRRVSGMCTSWVPYLRGRTTQHDTVRAAVAIGQ